MLEIQGLYDVAKGDWFGFGVSPPRVASGNTLWVSKDPQQLGSLPETIK